MIISVVFFLIMLSSLKFQEEKRRQTRIYHCRTCRTSVVTRNEKRRRVKYSGGKPFKQFVVNVVFFLYIKSFFRLDYLDYKKHSLNSLNSLIVNALYRTRRQTAAKTTNHKK